MIAPKLGVDMVKPSNDVLFDTGLKALQAGRGEEACANFQQVIDNDERHLVKTLLEAVKTFGM